MNAKLKKLEYNEIKEYSFLDDLLLWNKDKSLAYWIIVICSWLSMSSKVLNDSQGLAMAAQCFPMSRMVHQGSAGH